MKKSLFIEELEQLTQLHHYAETREERLEIEEQMEEVRLAMEMSEGYESLWDLKQLNDIFRV